MRVAVPPVWQHRRRPRGVRRVAQRAKQRRAEGASGPLRKLWHRWRPAGGSWGEGLHQLAQLRQRGRERGELDVRRRRESAQGPRGGGGVAPRGGAERGRPVGGQRRRGGRCSLHWHCCASRAPARCLAVSAVRDSSHMKGIKSRISHSHITVAYRMSVTGTDYVGDRHSGTLSQNTI